MIYTRKTFTLPEEVANRLGTERNQSSIVTEALLLLFNHKETVKKLARIAESMERKLEESMTKYESTDTIKDNRPLGSIQEQLEDLGFKLDSTVKGKAWSDEYQQYFPYKVERGKVII